MDRNQSASRPSIKPSVALRKESVDRNGKFVLQSPAKEVALRKESVDRNNFFQGLVGRGCCRSPQGERG